MFDFTARRMSSAPFQFLIYGFYCVVTMSLVPSEALAQAAAPGAQPPMFMSLMPIIFIFGIMYFFMIRPQMKKQKSHQEFLTKLKRGDEVITTGGLLGRVEGLTDHFATLEIAPGVRIKIIRTQIASSVPTVAANAEVKA